MNAQRTLIPALALVAGLACSATALAQPNGYAWGYERNRGGSRAAYDNGYRSGYERGEQDARGRRYDYGRHKEYRNGDWGYDRRDSDRDGYRRIFQQGFIAGYDDAFYGRGSRSGYSRTEPGYNRYPTYPTYPSSGYPTYPTYPTSPTYPNYPTYGRSGGYGVSEAYDRGYRDGLDKGRDDGKDRDRYDPRRQKWYRDGDRGYRREYGPREQYENTYREGFLRGYDEGYRSQQRW